MNAFDRILRIRECAKLLNWSQHEPEIRLNLWGTLSDEERYERGKFARHHTPSMSRWIASLAGLNGEGNTPEEAAEELERLVFDSIHKTLEDKVTAAKVIIENVEEVRRLIQEASKDR